MENFNWISVKDKMPEDGVDVLVCGVTKTEDGFETFVRQGAYGDLLWTDDNNMWCVEGITYYEDYYCGEFMGFVYLNEGEDYIVTSWMPMPDASEEALKLVTSKP